MNKIAPWANSNTRFFLAASSAPDRCQPVLLPTAGSSTSPGPAAPDCCVAASHARPTVPATASAFPGHCLHFCSRAPPPTLLPAAASQDSPGLVHHLTLAVGARCWPCSPLDTRRWCSVLRMWRISSIVIVVCLVLALFTTGHSPLVLGVGYRT